MEVHIGAPLKPPRAPSRMSLADLHGWHATIMSEIGLLCGKVWTPSGEHG
jgi:hypothetical protein